MAQSPVVPKHLCPDHIPELLVLVCKECGDLVCRKCVASSSHSGHSFETIEDASTTKEKKILDFIRHTEQNEVQNIQDSIKSVSAQLEENENANKILIDTIRSQGEEIKNKTEKITTQFIEICKTNTRKHNDLLGQFKTELQVLLSQLNEKVKNCKDALRSDDKALICEIAKIIERKLEIPTVPFLQNMVFTRGPLSNDLPQDGVGFLCKIIDSKVESEFMNISNITSVEDANSDNVGVWISNTKEKYLSLVNQQGKIIEKIDVGSIVSSISVSPKTSNVWCCCHQESVIGGTSYTVYEMLNSKLPCTDNDVKSHSSIRPSGRLKRKKRFSLDSIPLSLCITTEDDVVVGTFNKVTLFPSKGEPIHTSDTVCVPNNLVVSIGSSNIAVCDGDNDKPQVVVLDVTLKLKYRYHGLSKSQCYIFTSTFTPTGAVFDVQDRLIVADSGNKCIHLVSDEGHFLSVVYRDNLEITALTFIPKHDRLFVVFDKRNAKILKLPSVGP